MARESTDVQCYPSDEKIKATVKRYESFGWELLGNQRFQEFTGQTSDGDVITSHYSTYNKLAFTREVNVPWYSEVTALEKKHEEIIDRRDMYEGFRPERPKITKNIVALFCILFIASVVVMFILGELLGIQIAPVLLLLSPILMIVTAIVRNCRYKRAYNDWFATYYNQIKDLEKEAEAICEQARAIVLKGE